LATTDRADIVDDLHDYAAMDSLPVTTD